jgi:hypothetical protein
MNVIRVSQASTAPSHPLPPHVSSRVTLASQGIEFRDVTDKGVRRSTDNRAGVARPHRDGRRGRLGPHPLPIAPEVRLGLPESGRLAARYDARLRPHVVTHPGDVVFRHACAMGLEGIVSKRLGSRYRSGRSPDWLKFKNPEAPAVKREAEEDWGH